MFIPLLFSPFKPVTIAHDPDKQAWPPIVADDKPWETRRLQEEAKLNQEKPKRHSDHADAPVGCDEMANPYRKERRLCVLCKYSIELDYKVTNQLIVDNLNWI